MRATVFGSCLRRLLHSLNGRASLRRSQEEGRIPVAAGTTLPGISVIVRIADKDSRLPAMLSGLNSLDYPDDKLDVVFISEGSTDHTGDILRMTANPMRQIVVLRDPARRADTSDHVALNHAVSWAKHEILLFANTSTVFSANALTQLAGRFADPAVGAVRGTGAKETSSLKAFTWHDPSWLSMIHRADMGTCAVRRQCFLQLCENSLSQPRGESSATSPASGESRFVLPFPKITALPLTPSVLPR